MFKEESWEKFLMASIDYKMLLREEWKQQKKKKRAFMPRKKYISFTLNSSRFIWGMHSKEINLWRLVGGKSWKQTGEEIALRHEKALWLFHLKFMSHCFTLNCTKGKAKNRRKGKIVWTIGWICRLCHLEKLWKLHQLINRLRHKHYSWFHELLDCQHLIK